MNSYYDIFGMMNGQMNQPGLILCVIIIVLIIGLISILFIHRRHISRNGKLKQIIASIRLETDRLDEIIQKQKSVERDKEYLETANNELKNRAYQILDEFKSAGNSLRLCEEQISLAKTEIRDLNSRNESLQKELDEKQAALDEIKAATNQAKLELASLNSANKKLIAVLVGHLDTVNQTTQELSELQAEEKKLTGSVETLKDEIESLRNEKEIIKEVNTISNGLNIPEFKRIGYIPNINFRNDCYPAVYMPEANSIVHLPETYQRKIKGKSEPILEKELSKHFISGIYTDKMFRKEKEPKYSPDFCFIDESLNIYIDIEIDEPYYYDDKGIARVAHLKGQDNQRNTVFKSNGWIVIRFSESQVVRNPQGCCIFIAKVISSVNPEFRILQNSYDELGVESFWNELEANQFVKERYRENYLNDEIGPAVTEENVKSDLIPERRTEGRGNGNNSDLRKLIENYYDMWLKNEKPSKYASNLLTQLHRNHMPTGTNYGQSFFIQIINLTSHNINVHESDKIIIDNNYNIQSKVNLICKDNEFEDYSIYNWFSSEFSNKFQYSVGLDEQNDEIKRLIICSALEMNVCKTILESKQKMKVKNICFVLYSTNMGGGHLFSAANLPERTSELITFAKQNPLRK